MPQPITPSYWNDEYVSTARESEDTHRPGLGVAYNLHFEFLEKKK